MELSETLSEMELDETLSEIEPNGYADGRGRLASAALTVVLAAVAIGSLRRGKRLSTVLAGAGAVALGYIATAGSRPVRETHGIETGREDAELRCAACGDPIVPGQSRVPNENDETVHEACADASR